MIGGEWKRARGDRQSPLLAIELGTTHQRQLLGKKLAAVGQNLPLVNRFHIVESGCDAVTLGSGCLLPPLSSGGAQVPSPLLRFHTPLIEPDVQISRIRLSDRTSRLHPRRAASKLREAYETEVPVQVRGWIAPAPASSRFVLAAQPPT